MAPNQFTPLPYPLLSFKSNFSKYLLIIHFTCALSHSLIFSPIPLLNFLILLLMGFSRFTLVLILMSAFLPLSSPDPDDESCLTKLFESMEDPGHNLMNWTKPSFANPCSGFLSNLAGGTCNNGRIYKLSLPNLSLRGSISPYISNYSNLQAFDISNNSLIGPIPTQLQYLVNLAVLNLSANRLSATIPPSLAMCAYLNVIDLHDNALTGTIPPQLGERFGAVDLEKENDDFRFNFAE